MDQTHAAFAEAKRAKKSVPSNALAPMSTPSSIEAGGDDTDSLAIRVTIREAARREQQVPNPMEALRKEVLRKEALRKEAARVEAMRSEALSVQPRITLPSPRQLLPTTPGLYSSSIANWVLSAVDGNAAALTE